MKDLKIGNVVYLKSDHLKTPMVVEKVEENENIKIVHLLWMAPTKKMIRDQVPGDCITDAPPE